MVFRDRELTGLISCAAGVLDFGREGRDEGLGRADALEVGQGAASGSNAGLSWGLLQCTVSTSSECLVRVVMRGHTAHVGKLFKL